MKFSAWASLRGEMKLKRRIGNSLLRITRIKEEIRRRYGGGETERERDTRLLAHTCASARDSRGVDERGEVVVFVTCGRKEGRGVNRNETGVIRRRKRERAPPRCCDGAFCVCRALTIKRRRRRRRWRRRRRRIRVLYVRKRAMRKRCLRF